MIQIQLNNGGLIMLVLTRKEGEAIICTLEDGREIEITVTEINGNQVRLGIDAEQSINITRDELFQQ